MIKDLIKNKSAKDKATIKGSEIAKIDFTGEYISSEHGVKIDIQSIEAIEGGVQVFARAWKGNKQFGFGKDGSVEIERFRIYNPPILVEDDSGTIIREWIDIENISHEIKLKEDPVEAICQLISDNVLLIGKENTQIEKGKVGNTTSTFFPAAGQNSPVDGPVINDNDVWNTLHDATSGGSASPSAASGFAFSRFRSGSPQYSIHRSFFLFNTAAIDDADTIDSATLSLWGLDVRDNHTNGSKDMGIIQSSPASNADLVTGDFDQCGTVDNPTEGATRITFASLSTAQYNVFTLDSTGLGFIDKAGVSKFGARTSWDMDDLAPSNQNDNGSGMSMSMADEAGTSQDPKLVVEHSAASTFVPKIVMI